MRSSERKNKRQVLEDILQRIEPGWEIAKLSPLDPTDPDYLCIFQKPAEYKEARVEIPTSWFDDRELLKIEQSVRAAIRNPKPIS